MFLCFHIFDLSDVFFERHSGSNKNFKIKNDKQYFEWIEVLRLCY